VRDPVQSLNPEEGVREVAAAITVSVNLTDRRNIVVQTYIPRDASIEDYNEVLDKVGKAVDRQEAIYRIVDLKVNLETHKRTLKQLEDDYSRIEAKNAAEWKARNKQGEPRLNPNELAQKSTAEQNIKRYRVEITKIEADIAACQKVIDGKD